MKVVVIDFDVIEVKTLRIICCDEDKIMQG